MKKLFQILFFVLYPLIMYSQDSLRISTDTTRKPYSDSANGKLKRHTLFLELGGSAFYYSIKYDLILKQWNKFSINYAIGLSVLPYIIKKNNTRYYSYIISLPMQLSGLYGKNKSKLEFAVFILPAADIPNKKIILNYNPKNQYSFDTGIEIGYRYQKKQGGLFFKASFLAFYPGFGYGWVSDSHFVPWIGIGIGHTFK